MTSPDPTTWDAPPTTRALAGACVLGWAATTNYTNHAALMPVLMAELAFGPAEAGLLSTALFVALGLAFVPAGILSDRVGPKTVGALGLAVTFASNLALAFVDAFPGLLLTKLAGGLGAGAAFIAGVRYVTLAMPPARVYVAQGLYGGFTQLGSGTVLFLLTLLDARLGWRGAFGASSALVAAALALWIVLVPDHRMAAPPAGFGAAARRPAVWLLGLAHAASFGWSIVLGTWITTFFVRDLGVSLVAAGALGSGVLVAGIVSRPIGGWLVHRRVCTPQGLVSGCMAGGALGLVALAWPGRPVTAAALATLALGLVLSLPYAAVMNSASAAVARAPGAAVGMVSTIALGVMAIASPLIGLLLVRLGSFSWPFAALGVVCVAAFALTRGGRLR